MASTFTTNLNLEKPGIGEQDGDWGATLNSNFDGLDTAIASKVSASGTATLTNKTIDADNNTISNLEVDNLKSGVLDTDISSVSGSDDTLASAKSIKTYVDAQDSAIASDTLTFTNKTFDVEGTGNSISNIDVADLKSGVLDTDISSVSGSDDTLASAKAIKTYVDAQVATKDTLAELSDTSISSPAAGHLLIYDNTQSHFENATLTAGSNVSITNADGQITIASTDTNTQLNQEQVEDFVGGMLDGTETFIDVSYDDTDGNIDFVVPVKDEDNFASNSDAHLATQQSIKAYVDANAGGSVALDDIGTGDAASTLATSAGDITIDAQGSNTDIILKGTDGTSDITGIKIDFSEAAQVQLPNDSQALAFGADQDVLLTHVADTGLLLNSSRELQFGDSATHISQSADGTLELDSDVFIKLNAQRIDLIGSSNVLMQTSSAGGSPGFTFSALGTLTHGRSSGSAQSMTIYKNGTSIVGEIRTSTTATQFITSSDYRLKENVSGITDGIVRVKQLKPYRFNFIADSSTTLDGFLAHETQTVVPEAVSGTKDEMEDDGKTIKGQGIDQAKLVPLLTAALQEAIAKIEALETRVAALEG